jgi:hypothetical protein
MEKEKSSWVHKILKIIKWAFLIFIGLFLILIIGRIIYRINLDKTEKQIEKIHNVRLTLDDVMGKNLPPDPGAEADKTVQGIDANKNGIRDDVELAVFNTYPDSAKTRAVLLQYALALQMETLQPFVNTGIATEVVREQSRAFQCVGEVLVRDDNNTEVMDKYFKDGDTLRYFVKDKQLNTEERRNARNIFVKEVRFVILIIQVCLTKLKFFI